MSADRLAILTDDKSRTADDADYAPHLVTDGDPRAGTNTGQRPAVGSAHQIDFTYLSQEDLLRAGALDFRLAIDAAEQLLANRAGGVIFPDKIVQIFNQETQERINCLPATLHAERVCGMKWVSVFPPNVERFGLQNLTALF